MKKHIAWPSIEQFRNLVKNVEHKSAYAGKDEEGNAIFNRLAVKPTLIFEGTVKLHGTNASVCLAADGEMWVQSRENVITPEKDNAGFAMFVKSKEDAFNDLLVTARELYKHDPNNTIVVFGEWCGKGIQKGVAISELPKMFVIFGIASVDAEGNKTYYSRQMITNVVDGGREYVTTPNGSIPEKSGIYCIYDFPTFMFGIDFENPHEAQNTLNEVCMQVEAECPVGKAFGVSGIGEGIVIRCVYDGYNDSGFWAKIKGDKHSNSKVKTLATVDVERINNLKELAERLAHDGRLEQMAQKVFDTLNGGVVDISRTGEFIKAVMQDIFKEEIDVIAASGFIGKDLNGPISKIARDFIMKKL